MLNKDQFEKELKEIIENYKKDHQPITLAVSDLATRYNVSKHYVYNYIDLFIRKSDGDNMDFKGNKDISPEYVKKKIPRRVVPK